MYVQRFFSFRTRNTLQMPIQILQPTNVRTYPRSVSYTLCRKQHVLPIVYTEINDTLSMYRGASKIVRPKSRYERHSTNIVGVASACKQNKRPLRSFPNLIVKSTTSMIEMHIHKVGTKLDSFGVFTKRWFLASFHREKKREVTYNRISKWMKLSNIYICISACYSVLLSFVPHLFSGLLFNLYEICTDWKCCVHMHARTQHSLTYLFASNVSHVQTHTYYKQINTKRPIAVYIGYVEYLKHYIEWIKLRKRD